MYSAAASAISIHAPAKGATKCTDWNLPQNRNFNPRSREGSDEENKMQKSRFVISIHAPAKGATHESVCNQSIGAFQSTLPRRERHTLQADMIPVKKFQSTLPRRERPKPIMQEDSIMYFNPRSREGSDVVVSVNDYRIIISIHAPAKGATYLTQLYT